MGHAGQPNPRRPAGQTGPPPPAAPTAPQAARLARGAANAPPGYPGGTKGRKPVLRGLEGFGGQTGAKGLSNKKAARRLPAGLPLLVGLDVPTHLAAGLAGAVVLLQLVLDVEQGEVEGDVLDHQIAPA